MTRIRAALGPGSDVASALRTGRLTSRLARLRARLIRYLIGPVTAGIILGSTVLAGGTIHGAVKWMILTLLLLPGVLVHAHLRDEDHDFGLTDLAFVCLGAATFALAMAVAGLYAGGTLTLLVAISYQTHAAEALLPCLGVIAFVPRLYRLALSS